MCPLAGWASSGTIRAARAQTRSRRRDARVHPGRTRCPLLRHEHAGGGGHRQQRAEADEDLSDQGGLIPGRALAAACGAPARRRGRRLGRGHRRGRPRAAWLFVQRAIDIVELVGGDDLGLAAGLLSAGRSARPAGYRWPARTSPWRSPAGVSAEASSALALATDGRERGRIDAVAVGGAHRLAAAFVCRRISSATLPDLWCAYSCRGARCAGYL